MSKCTIFVSAISFGESDWTLAESTLSVFGCRCGGGGCGGDVCGGVMVVMVVVVVVMVVGVEVVILVGRNISMVHLWGSRWKWDAIPIY